MGHRALVAYERPDGRYDLHYSHWGAVDLALERDITPETPFGGPGSERDAEAAGSRRADETRSSTVVESEPTATGLRFEAIVSECLDFLHHEALYVVSIDHEVTAYRTFWFGTHGRPARAAEIVGNGALVETSRDDAGDASGRPMKRWFRTTRAVVRDMVERGALSEREATAYLAERVERRAGEERTVIHSRL